MRSLNEHLNEGMDYFIKSTDGKTFTILDKDKAEIKEVSKDELEKLMRVGNAYAPNSSWNDFMDKFDKSTPKGKHWKYWKGNEVNVSIAGLK